MSKNNSSTKRMRVFGGPNGSGKSTIFERIRTQVQIGHYLNPDELEQALRRQGFLHLSDYNLQCTKKEFEAYAAAQHTIFAKAKEQGLCIDIQFRDNILVNLSKTTNSYEAAFVAGFIRQALLKTKQSFSLETVMSHPSKVEMLQLSKQHDFKNYLYYICTESPIINIDRVRIRVAKGGHPVPESKIISRYYASLEQLAQAVLHTHRAYLFDNTPAQQPRLVAEVFKGREITFHQSSIPMWVDKYLLHKLL